MSTGSPFVAFDWDGVLHKCRSYHPGPFTDVDLSPVKEALARGWRVQIMTANDDLYGISRTLTKAGISPYVDYQMKWRDWPKERQSIVIVSHRKMWTDFLVDDRALQYHYGTGPEHLIAVMGALLDTLRVIQERERLSRMEAEK